MPRRLDSGDLLRRVGNLTQRDLLSLAEAYGWDVDLRRGKGSHAVVIRAGRRPVTIPAHRNRHTDRSIIRDLTA